MEQINVSAREEAWRNECKRFAAGFKQAREHKLEKEIEDWKQTDLENRHKRGLPLYIID